MVDMLMLQGAVTGLKMAGDIAKGFLKLNSMSEVQGLTIELQSTILAAQTSALAAQAEQSSMIQRISELEKEIARIEAWEEEKQRYQLVAAWDGCFLYALKESSKGTNQHIGYVNIVTKAGESRSSRTIRNARAEFIIQLNAPIASLKWKENRIDPNTREGDSLDERGGNWLSI